MTLIRFLLSLPCPLTIRTFFFASAHLPPDMDTSFSAREVAAEPTAVAKAFQGYAAVLAADPVVIAYPFGVFTYLHT